MSPLIPFRNEGVEFMLQVLHGGKVRNFQPLALEDTEPLFDLIHPGTVDRREVKDEPRMFCQPSFDLFAGMSAQVITDDVDTSNRCRYGVI